MLSEGQIKIYLVGLESQSVERSAATSNIDNFCKAICECSNDVANINRRGYVFIGVNDNGKQRGLRATDRLLKDLANIRSDGNILLQPVMSVYKHTLSEGDVVIIEVAPYRGNGKTIFDFDKMTVFGVTVYNAIELFRNGVVQKITENVAENRISAFLDLIKMNKQIAAEDAVKKLRVTKRTILRDIEQLKEKGKIKRIGPAKGSHREIICERYFVDRSIRFSH